jgi:hypothetical protein
MAVIEKDQGLGCLLRDILNIREEFLQFGLTIKVVISHRSRNIEPVGIPTMEPEITDL